MPSGSVRARSPRPEAASPRVLRRLSGGPKSPSFRSVSRERVFARSSVDSQGWAARSSTPESAVEEESINVVLRVRPFANYEVQARRGEEVCVWPVEDARAQHPTAVNLFERRPGNEEEVSYDIFHFDRIFFPPSLRSPTPADLASEQKTVYDVVGQPCLQSLLDDYNACIMAYGQTGAGKTHTMMGDDHHEGLIPLFCRELFNKYEAMPHVAQKAVVMQASFVEIYCEQIFDLLAPPDEGKKGGWSVGRHSVVESKRKPLNIRQHPVHGTSVAGVVSMPVTTWSEVEKVLQVGLAERSTGATSMNERSSRSHALFQITVETRVTESDRSHPWSSPKASTRLSASAIKFVDLAGSENLKKSGSDGARMHESIHINTSLLTLRRVIDQLLERTPHPAFRDSKLTRLLQDCLGGNSRTWFVACVSPSLANVDETKNTLRYAAKARRIQNRVQRNVDVGARLAGDIQQLKEELANSRGHELEELKATLAAYEQTRAELETDLASIRAKQAATEEEMQRLAEVAQRREEEMRRERVRTSRQVEEHQEEVLGYQKKVLDLEQKLTRTSDEVITKEHLIVAQQGVEQARGIEIEGLETQLLMMHEQSKEQKLELVRLQQKTLEVERTNEELRMSQEMLSTQEVQRIEARLQEEVAEKERLCEELTAKHREEMAEQAALYERKLSAAHAKTAEMTQRASELQRELDCVSQEASASRARTEQELARSRDEWERTSVLLRRSHLADKASLNDHIHDVRKTLEGEIQETRYELAQRVELHNKELEVEREKTRKAEKEAEECMDRLQQMHAKAVELETEIRGLTAMHRRLRNVTEEITEEELKGKGDDYAALVRDIQAWGKQLHSTRASVSVLLSLREGCSKRKEVVPSALEPIRATNLSWRVTRRKRMDAQWG